MQCDCGCQERLIVGSEIANDIRSALYDELGVTCCAGISYNKLLSKLVGEQHKPNQQTTLFPHQTQTFMSSMKKASKIPGKYGSFKRHPISFSGYMMIAYYYYMEGFILNL